MKRLLKHIKRFFHLHWPKLATAVIGSGLFGLSYLCTAQLQSLLINIAAALISIPIVFLLYELVNEKNHRRIIEYVYGFVNDRSFEIVDEAIKAVRVLMEGFMVYFEAGCAIYDDTEEETWIRITKYGQVRYTEDDDSWPEDYTHDDYGRDMMAACDDMEDDDYIFEFDNMSIIPHLAETAYLGYQVYSLNFEVYCDALDELVKNPLVLKHLEEERLIILLRLNESLQALDNAVHDKKALFIQTNRNIKAFRCELFGNFTNQLGYTGGCDLYYEDDSLSKLLHQDMLVNADEKLLTTVFLLDPDHLHLLGAQINEFMQWADEWRNYE